MWASDITYLQLRQGFVYLVAIIDWYSRYVLSWRLSNTLDVFLCREALEDALGKEDVGGYSIVIRVLSFTSSDFTGMLVSKEDSNQYGWSRTNI